MPVLEEMTWCRQGISSCIVNYLWHMGHRSHEFSTIFHSVTLNVCTTNLLAFHFINQWNWGKGSIFYEEKVLFSNAFQNKFSLIIFWIQSSNFLNSVFFQYVICLIVMHCILSDRCFTFLQFCLLSDDIGKYFSMRGFTSQMSMPPRALKIERPLCTPALNIREYIYAHNNVNNITCNALSIIIISIFVVIISIAISTGKNLFLIKRLMGLTCSFYVFTIWFMIYALFCVISGMVSNLTFFSSLPNSMTSAQ